MWFFAMFTFALLSLPAVVYMLYALMGSAAIVGFATLLVTYSSSAMMGSLIRPVVQRLQQRRDERGQLLSVLLQCMRLIKIQGSQPAMKCQLGAAREREMRELKFQRYLTAGNTLLGALLSLSVPVSMFSWYTIVQGQVLSPATAFTALAWIAQLRWSINALPGIYTVAATIRPSAQRLAQTLFEVRGTGASAGRGVDTIQREEATSQEVAVAMEDGTVCLPSLLSSGTHASLDSRRGGEGAPSARYEGMERAGEEEVGLLEGAVAEEVTVLDGISLEIRRGQLVVICGEVGAGKSTLLEALARARPLASGRLRVSGSRAYAGQKAFIMTGSVRDNILFQLPWEPDRYADVLARAQLLPDLALLAQGDLTLVGSEGVQLSGGQRARVALARVLYADADVMFLDDVMSALDAHTGAAVWHDALCWCKARGKTVVLATHQLHLLQRLEVDAVALVHHGRLVSFGPYAELMASSSSSCALLSQCRRDHEDGATREARGGGAGHVEVHQPCISGSGEEVERLAAAKDAAAGASNLSNAVCSDSSGETLSAQSSPADDAEHETGGMRMETMVRLLRAALRQLQGQRIDQAVIDRACDALMESCGDKTGGGGQAQGDVDERKKEGLISREDFMVYLHEFGTRAALVALAAVTIASALFSVGSNVFLAYWTDGNSHCPPAAGNSTLEELNPLVPSFYYWPAASTSTLLHHVSFVMRAAPLGVAGWVGAGGDGGQDRCEAEQQQRNLGMYALLGALAALLTCSQAVVLTPCALRASRGLHAKLVDALLAAPMSFFDATSAGAIMNRFLQDMANIDNFVPNAVMDLCAKSLDILTQIALVTFMAPSSLLIVPLLVPAYAAIYQRVRIGARDSKRIEAVAHTPVYSFFADLLRGRDTVAAFGEHHQRLFARANESRVRRLARATIGTQSLCELAPHRKVKEQAVRWHVCMRQPAATLTRAKTRAMAGKWAQALTVQTGAVLYFGCGVICVSLNACGRMEPAELALVLMFASQLQRASMEIMMTLTQVETQFVSVERIASYTRLEDECETDAFARALAARTHVRRAGADDGGVPGPDQCGASGELDVRGLWLRYGQKRPWVLRNVALRIPAGSKVAVCGRTGCGKSSLFAALARLYPLDKGSVVVDGTDLCQADLAAARRAVVLAAQEALLVNGSLLENLTLGMTGETVAVSHVWEVIDSVGLGSVVRELPGQLDAQISSDMFSHGQRQLLSLVRAILACSSESQAGGRRKVLLCDEPTSNVDVATDERVHEMLLRLPNTMLMICHRLHYIARFDRVFVMSRGRVEEHGEPLQLLADSNSALSALCRHAGLDPAGILARTP